MRENNAVQSNNIKRIVPDETFKEGNVQGTMQEFEKRAQHCGEEGQAIQPAAV